VLSSKFSFTQHPHLIQIRGQVLVGSILSGVGAYLLVRFLVKYFRTRTLTPFAIYCIVVGLGSIIYLGFIK
jgi:undecaprenyl-diphosphatase